MEHTDFVKFGDSARLSASLMYVPLQREGEPLGVLSIQSYTPNAYTAEDLQTLQALADHCGGALERIRAEQSLQEAHDRLERAGPGADLGIGGGERGVARERGAPAAGARGVQRGDLVLGRGQQHFDMG